MHNYTNTENNYTKVLFGKNIYFYDALLNEYTIVDEYFIDKLKKQDFNDVEYKQYIYKHGIRDIGVIPPLCFVSPYTEEIINQRLNQNITKLALSVTEKCSLDCSYCIYHDKHHSNKKQQDMTWTTAKKAIDWFCNLSTTRNKVFFAFYGGECLLNFELIVRCVDYIDKTYVGGVPSYTLTTNGLKLDDDRIIDFLVKKDFFITISLDGPKCIHDKYRIDYKNNGSYDRLIENIKKVREKYPDFYRNNITFNAVIASPSKLKVVDDFLYKTKLQYSMSNLSITKYFHDNYYNDYEGVDSFSEFGYSDTFYKKRLYELKKFRKIKKNCDENIHKYYQGNYKSLPGGPCIPSFSRLFVNCRGEMFPCEKIEETQWSCIGDVDDGLNLGRVIDMINRYVNIASTKCNNCWCISLCNSCHVNIDENCSHIREQIEDDLLYYLDHAIDDVLKLRLIDGVDS